MPFTTDSVWGAYQVLAIVGMMDDGSRRQKIRARCIKCGAEHEVSSNTLRQSKNNRAKSCVSCLWQRPQHEPRSHKRCRKCEGMPWRRPVNKPCKCGETFKPECVPAQELMHSSAGTWT